MLPSEGYVTTEDGIHLFFQKFGDSPNAVIIPNAVHMFDSFKHLADNRTIVLFDLRNRGNSDSVSDRSKLTRGIHQDIDDLEAVRQHFGIREVDVIGHSNVGLMVILYAIKYPAHLRRLVQIGASQPDASTQYHPSRGGGCIEAEGAGPCHPWHARPPSAVRWWKRMGVDIAKCALSDSGKRSSRALD